MPLESCHGGVTLEAGTRRGAGASVLAPLPRATRAGLGSGNGSLVLPETRGRVVLPGTLRPLPPWPTPPAPGLAPCLVPVRTGSEGWPAQGLSGHGVPAREEARGGGVAAACGGMGDNARWE